MCMSLSSFSTPINAASGLDWEETSSRATNKLGDRGRTEDRSWECRFYDCSLCMEIMEIYNEKWEVNAYE